MISPAVDINDNFTNLDDVETIGSRLKASRVRKGMSQHEVSMATGFDKTMISRWENDRAVPRSDAVASLCEALGEDIRWLITGEYSEGSGPERPVPPGLAEFLASEYAQKYVPPEAASILKRLRAAEGDKIHEWTADRWKSMWYAMEKLPAHIRVPDAREVT